MTGGYQDPGRFVRLSLAESIRKADARCREAEKEVPALQEKVHATSGRLEELHSQRRAKQEEREQARARMMAIAERVQSLEANATANGRSACELREWRHRTQVLIDENQVSIEAKKLELQSKTLSGLGPEEEEALLNFANEVQELESALEGKKAEFLSVRGHVEQQEAQVESFLRARVHELERHAASGSQDNAVEQSEEASQELARLEREHRELEDAGEVLASELEALQNGCASAKSALESCNEEEQKLQEQAVELSVVGDQLTAEVKALLQKKEEVDGRLAAVSAPATNVDECKQLPKPELVRELAQATKDLQKFEHVNRKAVEQYENFSEQLADLSRRKEQIDTAEASIGEALKNIDEQKETTILSALQKVNEHFQQVFTELVPGGLGKLEVAHERDSDTQEAGMGSLSGVRIEVSFTGHVNSFVNMNQLSGGQKTVVALTLIFAIQRLEPAPFYLLDEVDAALDSSYRSALANLIGKIAKSSQVVMTTFRTEALERADRCYRVYQQNRASRIVNITSEQAQHVLREQDRLVQAAGA